jgi:hypothetical protein
MPHGDLAQLSAVIGGLGAAAMLLSRTRAQLLAGLAATAAGEAALAASLIPGADLELLVRPASHAAALAAAVVAVGAGGLALVRYPAAAPVVLLAAAPFRISVSIGSQKAYLLVPLYAVLAAAGIALTVRALRREVGAPLPPIFAIPGATFVLIAGVSLLWTRDLRQGSIELLFFLFPFSALVVAAARTPFRPWHPRALAATLVTLAALFSGVALFQRLTHGHLLAGDVERANAYTTYFRVTSLFKDPSIFGRIGFWTGTALLAFLWAGLFFSYSQSSFVALFAVGLAVSYALGGSALRRFLLVGAAACVLAGAAFVAANAVSDSARQATSGRTRLARVTWVVFTNHPLAGVGIGGQPRASKEEANTQLSAQRDRSHTTPLTVAAELGVIGLLVYAALLAGAARLLAVLTRANRPLGLAAAAVFVALFVHSLFYAGFFEDPIVWGVMALAGWAVAALPLARRHPVVVAPAQDGASRRTALELQHQGPLAD